MFSPYVYGEITQSDEQIRQMRILCIVLLARIFKFWALVIL